MDGLINLDDGEDLIKLKSISKQGEEDDLTGDKAAASQELVDKTASSSTNAFEERDRYVEECHRVIQQDLTVQDIVVVNKLGNPIRSTLEHDISVKYSGLIDQLLARTQAVVKLLDDSGVEEIRLKTNKHEVYILPDEYELTFVVHQAPMEENRHCQD